MRSRASEILGILSPATRKRLVVAMGGSLLVALLETAGVLMIAPLMLLITSGRTSTGVIGFISRALGDPTDRKLSVVLAISIVTVFVVKAVTTVAFRWWVLGMVAREDVQTSTEILRHYVRLPYVDHVRRGTPELIRTMNDAVAQFYGSVLTGALSVVTEAVSIVAIVLALVISAPLPTLVLGAYFGAAVWLYQRLAKPHITRIGLALIDLSVRTYMAAFHVLGGIKAIKLRGTGEYFISEYEQTRVESARARRVGAILGELPKYILETLFVLGIGVTTAVIFSLRPSDQALSLLALFVAAGFRVLPSTTRLLASVNAVGVGLPAADLVVAEIRAARRLEHEETPSTRPTVGRLPFTRSLDLAGLSFRYPEAAEDAIRNVTLRIPPGGSVAIVGGSGAGKSTLVDLVLGLHTPSSGTISVDGVDVATDLPAWRRNLAMVPQEVYLIDKTLRENIAFGIDPATIDEGQLLHAVAAAQLESLVAELPDGLHTLVGERGSRLSGGQRQRIGIARALYDDPVVLVLDEATSALDNITERKIADTIEALSGAITVIVVAHRLSTVRHCETVVYLEEGSVRAVGSFEEVQEQNATFARLVELGRLDIGAIRSSTDG